MSRARFLQGFLRSLLIMIFWWGHFRHTHIPFKKKKHKLFARLDETMIKDDDARVNYIMTHVLRSKAPGEMTACQVHCVLIIRQTCVPKHTQSWQLNWINGRRDWYGKHSSTASLSAVQNVSQPCKCLQRHSHYIYCPRSSSRPEDRQRPLFKSLLNSTYGPSLLTGLKTDCFSL